MSDAPIARPVVEAEAQLQRRLDFALSHCTLFCVATEENQSMNVLSKVKSDSRVAALKEAVDSGERPDRTEPRIASGADKKPHPDDKMPTL